MKFFTTLLLIVLTYSAFSQSSVYEISELEVNKEKLLEEIKQLQHQVDAIDQQISVLQRETPSEVNEEIITESKITLNGALRSSPTAGNNEIVKLKKGTKVEVLGIEGDYYKIRCNGNIGFVNSVFLYDPALLKLSEEIKKREREESKLRMAEVKREKYQDLIDEFGPIDGAAIAKKKVRLGMTEKMVIRSWGRPKDINRTTGSWGVHEQWVYDNERYLYFENGKLTTIQD